MNDEDIGKMQRFITSLGYENVRVRDGGVADLGRDDVVMVFVNRWNGDGSRKQKPPEALREALRLSQQQEKRIAKKTGGKVNPGSGSQWRHKNDVREKGVLWEMKRSNLKSITIKANDLEQLRREAMLAGQQPIMHIELGKRRYVLMEEDDYFD